MATLIKQMPRSSVQYKATSFSVYNSYDRISRLVAAGRTASRKISPVRDHETEEMCRLEQWSTSEPSQPWDKWFENDTTSDDVHDCTSANRIHCMNKEEYKPGVLSPISVIVKDQVQSLNTSRSAKALDQKSVTDCFRNRNNHISKNSDVVEICRRRRATSSMSFMTDMQRALSWYVFRALSKCFNAWKRSTRIGSWARVRPDPYGEYSSWRHCNSTSKLLPASANKNIQESGHRPATISLDDSNSFQKLDPYDHESSSTAVVVKVYADGRECEDIHQQVDPEVSLFSFKAREEYFDRLAAKTLAEKTAAQIRAANDLRKRRQVTLNQLEEVPYHSTRDLFEDPRFDEATAYVDNFLKKRWQAVKYGLKTNKHKQAAGRMSPQFILKARLDYLNLKSREERLQQKEAQRKKRMIDFANAQEWIQNTMREEQESIQLRIGKKFEAQIHEEGKSIRDIFTAFDEDRGGTIDHDELREGFNALGVQLSHQEFHIMLRVWDSKNSGEIDFEEFAEMFEKTLLVLEMDRNKAACEWMNANLQDKQKVIQKSIAERFQLLIEDEDKTIRDIFVAFDEDGGGTIDHNELRHGFDSLGISIDEETFTTMLQVWDPDKKGEIEFDSFTKMFENTLLVLENGVHDPDASKTGGNAQLEGGKPTSGKDCSKQKQRSLSPNNVSCQTMDSEDATVEEEDQQFFEFLSKLINDESLDRPVVQDEALHKTDLKIKPHRPSSRRSTTSAIYRPTAMKNRAESDKIHKASPKKWYSTEQHNLSRLLSRGRKSLSRRFTGPETTSLSLGLKRRQEVGARRKTDLCCKRVSNARCKKSVEPLNACTFVAHINGHLNSKTSPNASSSVRTLVCRAVQPQVIRAVVVDDSKPFRLRLRYMLTRLINGISVTLCASPEEALNEVLGTHSRIHIILVDQVFVGSKTTGQEMCDILARRPKTVSSSLSCNERNRTMVPCVLISDHPEIIYPCVEPAKINSERRFSGRLASSTSCDHREQQQEKVTHKGSRAPQLPQLYKIPSAHQVGHRGAQGSNIVERCQKREISSQLIHQWFNSYVIGGMNSAYLPSRPHAK